MHLLIVVLSLRAGGVAAAMDDAERADAVTPQACRDLAAMEGAECKVTFKRLKASAPMCDAATYRAREEERACDQYMLPTHDEASWSHR